MRTNDVTMGAAKFGLLILCVTAAVLLVLTFTLKALAQTPSASVSRESAIIEALQQQRNQANDAVVACYGDARKRVAELEAKIAELEKAAKPAAPAPAKK